MTRDEAIGSLRALLRPGQRIYTLLRHWSRTTNRRSISVFAVDIAGPRAGTLHSLDGLVASALQRRINRTHGGVICDVHGMDAAADLVIELQRVLFPTETKELYHQVL